MGVAVKKSKVVVGNLLFDNDKIYNVEDVVNNFSLYFGISFDEMIEMYSNYSIIKKDDVIKYVHDCFSNKVFLNRNLSKLLEERIRDYNFYKERVVVLGHKGSNYLKVLKYVADSNSIFLEDDFYEKALENLEVFHFSKGMTGKHLNKIMIALYHIMNEFKSNLNEINRLDGYNNQRISEFNLIFGEEQFAYNDCLVLTDDRILDKTSLRKVYKR